MKNGIISKLHLDSKQNTKDKFIIENCVIGKLTFQSDFISELEIRKCIINDFIGVAHTFEKQFLMSECIVVDRITFSDTTSNMENTKIILKKNIFKCFIDFTDTHFRGPFVFRKNILLEGSNLLGNKGKGFETLFFSTVDILDNIGDIYVRG